MKSILTRIMDGIKRFVAPCTHVWIKPRRINDYDLRSGAEHQSIVKTCCKCGCVRTFPEGYS